MNSAGLPNITGSVGLLSLSSGLVAYQNPSGAFYGYTDAEPYASSTTTHEGILGDANSGFDASLSNNLYGNSETVQPKSTTTIYVIKH